MRLSAAFLIFLGVVMGAAAQKVSRAYVGDDGLVHIALQGKVEFVAPSEMRMRGQRIGDAEDLQKSVERPVVAPDRRTVAWIVNFPNCCTSYPIPLTLVVFRDGAIIQRFGGMPIFKFAFERGGHQIAFYMDTLHGQSAAWCQLRDVASGRLLDEWRLTDRRAIPGWAKPFQAELTAAGK